MTSPRIIATLLTVGALVLGVGGPAAASCAGPNPGPSDPLAEEIRHAHLLAWGVIRPDVPRDAHGAFSFYLDVKRYFRGAGPSRIEVTSYSDGDLPANSDRPGSATAGSKTFLKTAGGQQAVLFLSPERQGFAGYSVGCDSSVFETRAAESLLLKIQSVLGLPRTGAPATALALVGSTLLLAGIALGRSRTRRKRSDTNSAS